MDIQDEAVLTGETREAIVGLGSKVEEKAFQRGTA